MRLCRCTVPRCRPLLLAALLLALPSAGGARAQALPAFPGAEGFGATTPGGRGGAVLFVTTLADDGPGSLRAAVGTPGPRTIIFRVAGTIELASPIEVRYPDVTIAGQTAPGDGVTLANYGMVIRTHDVILRYLRFRPGDTSGDETDALWVVGAYDVVIDHVSASWGIDETLSVTRSRDVTVQWSFITESLNDAYHSKGRHGYGSLVSASSGSYTFHHNLWAHHNSRNPRPQGTDADLPGLLLDFRNNVVYNWGDRAGYTAAAEPMRLNYVNNYFKAGPSTDDPDEAFVIENNSPTLAGRPSPSMFVAGNVIDGYPARTADNWAAVRGELAHNRAAAAFDAPPVATQSAEDAYALVLAGAGASLPGRDSVDARIVADVRAGTGRIIDAQAEVGGWPVLRTAAPPADTDLDGLPDAWETAHGFDPAVATPSTADADGDGYTDVEEYLNATDPHRTDLTVGREAAAAVPDAPVAVDAYPNPFRDGATLAVRLDRPADVRADVVDVLGRTVAVLADGRRSAGTHHLRLDGAGLAPGVYFLRLRTAYGHAVVRLVRVE